MTVPLPLRCSVCHQEVPYSQGSRQAFYEVYFVPTDYIYDYGRDPSRNGDLQYISFDVCPECARKIRDYLRELSASGEDKEDQ